MLFSKAEELGVCIVIKKAQMIRGSKMYECRGYDAVIGRDENRAEGIT